MVEDLLSGVRRDCGAGLTAKALRERVVARVRAHVPFDGHLFALTDPTTRVMTSPHADLPMLAWSRLPELIRLRYLTLVNRADLLLERPACSLLTATADPDESLVWREVQRDLGVTDTASVAFADRWGSWGLLELWRTGGAFSRIELDLLTTLQAALPAGLRAALARTFVDPEHQLLPVGPAVVLLGPDLAVQSQTEGAAAALLALNPPDEPMAPIPAAAYNIGAALLAQEQGVPVGEPWARVHLGGSRWVTVKASRLGSGIAVSIEPATPSERLDLLARTVGLSGREVQVLQHLGGGAASREIASALLLSEHTVNDHVKSILAKTGARTRQVLVARALGAP